MVVPQTEIVVTKDGTEIVRKTVPPGDYVIGCDAGCDLPIAAGQVARRHAQLTINYDHALIADLGSESGTFVNGKPVTASTRLWPNQKIQVGAVSVELHRLKTDSSRDHSVPPQTAAMRKMLPEEFLREKKYDIGGVVAQGGMGAILDANEAAIERQVAMKVMLDGSNPDDLVRFIAEAKITGQLEHPNIVPVHELNVDENDQVFYTMKLVRGVTLRQVLEHLAQAEAETVRKYPLSALLTIFQKVCDAVAFAHSKQVIHRDLKPENIMLGDYGEVLVMDWGLAKKIGGTRSGASQTSDLASEDQGRAGARPSEFPSGTVAGSIMGTPQYMAPEQARGEIDALDARSDIYALGAILYHMLTLCMPVESGTLDEILAKVSAGQIVAPIQRVLSAQPSPTAPGAIPQPTPTSPVDPGAPTLVHTEANSPSATRPKEPPTAQRAALPHLPGGSVPESLNAVVMKAMALDQAARYQSIVEFQADLTAYQTGFATGAEKAGVIKQLALLIKRHKGIFSTAAAAWLIITALAVWFVLNVTHERNVAARERDRATANEKRAVDTLTELRGTAPTFAAQAKALLDEGKFDAALQKIGYAIQLDSGNADYRLFRANLLEATQDLAEAAAEYRGVLALRSDDEAAKTNLALCERLLAENGGAPTLPRALQKQLLAALREQQRLVEAGPLGALFEEDAAVAEATLLGRLAAYQQQSGWSKNAHRIVREPDGTFKVYLSGLALGDLTVLKNQPISVLGLADTDVADLRGLTGLPLKVLYLAHSRVTDLSPLAGMKLRYLDLSRAPVSDLRPLAGMPLEELFLADTHIANLAPLRGAPLAHLAIQRTQVADLSPLADAPLNNLDLTSTRVTDLTPLANCTKLQRLVIYSTAVRDLAPLAKLQLTELHCSTTRINSVAPLRGQPLRLVDLHATPVTDLSPLADCVTLEEITFPGGIAKNVELLRKLPRLKMISTRLNGDGPAQTAEEFWKEYDAQQAAGK